MSTATMERTTAPDRSLAQRRSALELANKIRTHRAQVKLGLASGRLALEDVFSDPLCATMRLTNALLAIRGLGRVKVAKMLNKSRVSPSKTIAGLSPRQRDEILKTINDRPAFGR